MTGGRPITFKFKKKRAPVTLSPQLNFRRKILIFLKPRSLPWSNLSKFPDFCNGGEIINREKGRVNFVHKSMGARPYM